MTDLNSVDSISVFGRNLTLLRGPVAIASAPDYLSPLSRRNAVAVANIVRDGYRGDISFGTGQTSGPDVPSEARAMYQLFISKLDTKPANNIHFLEEALYTGDDVQHALEHITRMGYLSPAILSTAEHVHAIRKFLPVNHAVRLLKAEDFITAGELRLLNDGAVIFEKTIESLAGRFVSGRMRRFLASVQRPGMRK